MKNQHPNWGGKRQGAGRPADYDETKKRSSVALPPSWWQRLIAEFGSKQAAIEELVKRHLNIE